MQVIVWRRAEGEVFTERSIEAPLAMVQIEQYRRLGLSDIRTQRYLETTHAKHPLVKSSQEIGTSFDSEMQNLH